MSHSDAASQTDLRPTSSLAEGVMPEVRACPDIQEFLQLVLGKAPPEEAERLGRHLLSCPSCVDTLHGLKAENTLIQQLQAQATAPGRPINDLIDSVIRRLQESATGPGQAGIPQQTVAFEALQNVAQGDEACDLLLGAQKPAEQGRIGNYRVLRVLGSGGMGFVLRAEDMDLERPVALKVMRPDIARDPAARQRFLREARAAAALKHDHVVTIYQVGQEKEVPFLAMELLEGESLEARLVREGKLPVADVLRIGREIAAGLAAAHEHRLIHRDIKPANIWLEAGTGRVKILDFGLARAAGSRSDLTQTGNVVGTPEFMSPEQARGVDVDARSDLFSLGSVLYALCTGVKPFQGHSAMAVLTALAVDTPPSVRDRNPDVPPALAELVERLLAKDPAQRPASAVEVEHALAAIVAGAPAASGIRPLLPTRAVAACPTPARAQPTPSLPRRRRLVLGVAGGVLGLALVAAVVFRLTRPSPRPEPAKKSADVLRVITLLPFTDAAADPDTQYLRDGIPGALEKKLSEIEQLTVRPYSGGTKKPGDELDLRELGRRLDVQAVLTGRVHQSRDRLSVQVELVNVRDNRVIWVEQYDRRPADLQDIETSIAQRICARLGISLSGEEESRLTRRDTADPEAHRLYLQGRSYMLRSTLEGMKQSLAYFKQAIARDPKYALAYAGLADAYGYYAGDWLPYEEALPHQKSAARKAMELDDDLAEAHLAMGNVYMGQDYDWPAAEREFQRAIERRPRLDLAHDAYAQLLAFQGRFAESLAQQQEALDINPRSASLLADMSYLYYVQRRYDEALEQARKALEIEPDFVVAHDYLAAALQQKGQHAEALGEFRVCRQLDQVPWYLARLAAAQALAGNREEARALLTELQEQSKKRYVTPECHFLVHVALGERNQAFAWLRKMYEVRSQYPLRLKVQPDFDPLRDDPRFAEWLRRLNLAPSPDGSPGPGTVASPHGEPVKVGVLHSLSGTMAGSEAVVVDAVRFALDEVNQAGGVLGRPVQAVVADGRSDWPTFAREAERLITQEKVCTVFGCWTSASRKTVKPVFEEHDHLLIYPVQFEGLETSPCIFYVGAAPNQQILPAVEWAVTSLHKKRFFLVGSDYVFPRAAHAIIKDDLRRAGAQVVGEEYLPLGSQKAEAVAGAVARAKPDMILNTINGDSNTAFFRALRAAGVTPASTPTLSFSVGEQELRSLNLADLAGDYAAWTYFQSVATPENREFVRRFHQKYPERSITDPMETAYLGVKLWALAVNEAQSLDPKKVRRALLNQHLQGPGGEVRIDPDTQYCYRTPRIGQVQADGQFKVVWSAPAPVRPQAYPGSRSAEAWQAFLHDLYTGWGNRWAAPEAKIPGGNRPPKGGEGNGR
jgi:urea transport system substrate-binding protein